MFDLSVLLVCVTPPSVGVQACNLTSLLTAYSPQYTVVVGRADLDEETSK